MAEESFQSIKDFLIEKQIGIGGYGKIVLAKHKATNNLYALKIMPKRNVQKSKRLMTAEVEKHCLEILDNKYIVKMLGYFEDPLNYNYVLEYVDNGDMFSRRASIIASIPSIISQVVHALAYMHTKNVIHRDIKLENILLDKDNNVKICDFGSAKIAELDSNGFCRSSYIGSADYTAPEILEKTDISPALDLWDLGCTIYATYHGRGPFFSQNRLEIFNNIRSCTYTFHEDIPEPAKDLISKLLKLDPHERLGFGDYVNGYALILSHPFFN